MGASSDHLLSCWNGLCGCFEDWCVSVFSCTCVRVHSPTAVFTAGAKHLKENTKHQAVVGFALCVWMYTKSQCLCSWTISAVFVYSMCILPLHGSTVSVYVSVFLYCMWLGVFACVCVGCYDDGADSHGSVIHLIKTAAWRKRLPFTAAVTGKWSQVDKPHQQI